MKAGNRLFLFAMAVLLNPVLTRCQIPPLFSTPGNDDAIPRGAIADALAVICPGGNITKANDGKITGCAECPPGTDMQNLEGASWGWTHAIVGHFVSQDFDTLLLSGRGCEPHSLSFGGTFVLNVGPWGARLLDYRKGLITEDCRKLVRGAGLDFPVCADRWGAQGYQAFYLYSVVFDSTGKSIVQGVFTTDDDVLACGADVSGNFLGPVRHSFIKAVQFESVGKSATLRMSVTVALGKRVLTNSESKVSIDRPRDDDSRDAPVVVPTKDYHVEFLFDGKWFQVAPGSRATLKRFPKPEYPVGIAF